MTRRCFVPCAVLAVLSVGVFLAGCASTAPSRFYVLSSLPAPGPASKPFTDQGRTAIGIGPVEISKYLDRPQIVTRESPNELKLAEFDNWAEPLGDNLPRVLAENLSTLLSTEPVAVFPWRGSTPVDYRVEVVVTQLDGELGGDAVLVGHWSIIKEDGNELIAIRETRFSEPTGASGYEALVSAMSRAIGNLSQQIAAEIQKYLP